MNAGTASTRRPARFFYVSYLWRGESHRADTLDGSFSLASDLARRLRSDGWVGVEIVRVR